MPAYILVFKKNYRHHPFRDFEIWEHQQRFSAGKSLRTFREKAFDRKETVQIMDH